MFELVPRYIIGLLLGVCLGLIWSFLASWWIVAYLFAVLAISEMLGRSGFGSHWDEYRFSFYLLYSFPFWIIALGILFGASAVGSFFVTLGKIIS